MRCANRSSPYPQHPGKLPDGVLVDDLLRGPAAPLIHAHVEAGVAGIGETALRVVEVHGRHAEVEEHRRRADADVPSTSASRS
jgi:hypothetical protein